MSPVAVRLLHVEAGPAAGSLERGLATVRRSVAERVAAAFGETGAADVAILAGPPDDTPFGRRIRELVTREHPDGLVLAGSGALALARPRDLRAFLDAAASVQRRALANNRYSADAIAVACAAVLAGLPDLPADNGLPRWLAETAGYEVSDFRGRRRLQVDIDGPLDALLVGEVWPDEADVAGARKRLAQVAAVGRDASAELVVAGRTSASILSWLEREVPARVRALVEERGMRASGGANRRPPRSVLGLVLDREGPEALGRVLAELGDAAAVDSRVLLAHRLGADERSWPPPGDRFASDLLLADRVTDPWLRALTEAAATAPIPVLLGGHTLVGPGLPLGLGGRR